MDAAGLRAALAGAAARPGSTGPHGPRAVIAMLERHACRLEQLPVPTRANAEPLARALRAAQRLYSLAAVTVGDGGDLLVDAARQAGPGAYPDQVLAAPTVAVAQDVFGRLKTALGGRAGVVVVMPAPARLAAEAGLAPAAAVALLLGALHAFGAAEPDAFVLTGDDPGLSPACDAVAAFYGAVLIKAGEPPTPGVAVRADLAPGDGYAAEFCVVTPAEIDPALTPAEVRSRIAAAQTMQAPVRGTVPGTAPETSPGTVRR